MIKDFFFLFLDRKVSQSYFFSEEFLDRLLVHGLHMEVPIISLRSDPHGIPRYFIGGFKKETVEQSRLLIGSRIHFWKSYLYRSRAAHCKLQGMARGEGRMGGSIKSGI